MTDIWLTVKEVSTLLGVSTRTISRKIEKGDLPAELEKTGKGKKGYVINLFSLSPEAQKRYASEQSKAESRLSLAEMKEWQRDSAFECLEVLTAWENFAKSKRQSMNQVVNEFVILYKEEHPGVKISRGTLYRWRSRREQNGPAGVAKKYGNKKEKFSEETISPEAKKFFLDLYLDQNLPCASTCYFHLGREAKKNGWKVPSYTTIKRLVKEIPEPVRLKLRYGKKAFDDKAVAPIRRDIERVKANELWESDHHQLDVAVVRHDGSIGFPWITVWQDVRTRKILSWSMVSKPSSDSINISFHEAVWTYGTPADGVILDNGKDYRARQFTGFRGKRMRVEAKDIKVSHNKVRMEGIYGDLKIKTHWAIPYNAKAKQIEPFFGVFEREFGKFWPGYRGGNVVKRPEKLKDEWREKKMVPFEELKEGIQRYMNYFNEERQHGGEGMEKRTPNAVYFSQVKRKRAVRDAELSLLFSSWPKPATVQSSGVYFFNDWYWNEKMAKDYLNRRVFLRYSEDNIERIYIYDDQGKYLCAAEKQTKGFYGMKSEDYERLNRKKKVIRESAKIWEAENIGKRMTADERKGLVVSLGALNKTEPALESDFVKTRYAAIVAEEDRRADNERKKAKAMETMQNKYTPHFTDEDTTVNDGVNNFLQNYGRSK